MKVIDLEIRSYLEYPYDKNDLTIQLKIDTVLFDEITRKSIKKFPKNEQHKERAIYLLRKISKEAKNQTP